ncbi:hypothetical protein ABZP36_021400 [Zizania latifolia]
MAMICAWRSNGSEVAGGSSSTFALYSHALKVALGADQRRLALLGVACDVGENLGLLPGVLCNRLHPALLLLVGAAACLVGYGTAWFTVSGSEPVLPYWQVKDTPTDDIDYMHPNSDDNFIPALCIGSPFHTSCFCCFTWHLLWCPILGDGVNFIGAFWTEALRKDFQFYLLGESTWRPLV